MIGLVFLALYGYLQRNELEKLVDKEDFDVVLYLGDAVRKETLEELASVGKPVYAVSGRYDDTYIAKLLSENYVLIDGRSVYVGNDTYVFGVGGREPLMNIHTILREYVSTGQRKSGACSVLLTYYPPHGVMDEDILGIHYGVYELNKLVSILKPRAVVIARPQPCSLWIGPTCFISPGHAQRKCFGIVELNPYEHCEVYCKVLCMGSM